MRRPVAKKWIRGPVDELAIREGCYFDESKGRRALAFLRTFCRQSQGKKWAGKPLDPFPWQEDFLMRLFGWRLPDGRRRFARVYLEVAKKNGKSTLLAGLELAFLLIDGEPAPEVYICAVNRKQASIIYDESRRMVMASPELRARLDIVRSRKEIQDPEGNGKIVAMSADAPGSDGMNASHVIFDELHRQKSRELWEVMEYASAARDEPLFASLTTAGLDRSGLWHEQRDYSERVNLGEIKDITHLGIVYRCPEDADLEDPRVWKLANPSLGLTIDPARFGRELAEARRLPSKWANFLRLRLGIVSGSTASFVDGPRWRAMGGERIDPATLRGRDCYLGLDVSSFVDLTALVALFPMPDGTFVVLAWFWVPEEGIEAKELEDDCPYRRHAEAGHITLCPGAEVDYQSIKERAEWCRDEFNVIRAAGDKWQAKQLLQELESAGVEGVEVSQTFYGLSRPTKLLEAWLASRRIRHGNNPILNYCADNCVVEKDSAGNIKLSKSKSRRRIDGMAALVDSIAAFDFAGEDAGESCYEHSDLIVIGGGDD